VGNVGQGDRLAPTPAALSAFHADDIARASRTARFTVTMSVNGTLTPPSLPPAPTSPSAAKRKHAATKSIVSNGASVTAQGHSTPKSSYTLQMVLGDILSVLKRYVAKKRRACTCYVTPVVRAGMMRSHTCPESESRCAASKAFGAQGTIAYKTDT
jgi:hypothetical protein